MNLKDYQPWALTLANRKGFDFDLDHAAFGMFTEAGELVDAQKRFAVYGKAYDRVNIIEETGDGMWYVILAVAALGTTIERVLLRPRSNGGIADFARQTQTIKGTIFLLGVAAAGFAALCLEYCADGEAFEGGLSLSEGELRLSEGEKGEFLEVLHVYLLLLKRVGEHFGFTLEEAAQVNFEKLSKRYPNGFTKSDAINRDVAAERAVMEGALNQAG